MQENEVTTDEIKAFMAEPEEPKAPAPVMMDDFSQSPEHEFVKGRLTTGEMTNAAYNAALDVAELLGVDWFGSQIDMPIFDHWTNFIIQSASNPNGYDACREMYETEIMRAYDRGDVLRIPFSKLTTQEKIPWFTYRSTIIVLLPVWAGH